jgi:radical SAM protein with 4Fe4S-binding SPASM domain
MVKKRALSLGRLPLYWYLIGAYSRFLTVGKCLDYPLVLQVQTQSYCNGCCAICPYPVVSKKLYQGTMEWDLFVKIASESASASLLSTIVFQLHNEPLLDKRIFDCVKYLKSISPDKSCKIVTNGEFLDRFNSTDIMQSNLDFLVISLNAHSKQMYESINKGLEYDRVMKNVSRLVSDQYIRQRVTLSFVRTEQNTLEIHQATQYWKKQRINTRVIVVTNRAGSLENYERVRLKTGYYDSTFLSRMWRRLMSGTGDAIRCDLPFYHMNILFNGDAIICCHDWNRTSVVGNVRTSSLYEIWNSKKMNEIRRLILKKRYEQINSCQECSLVR